MFKGPCNAIFLTTLLHEFTAFALEEDGVGKRKGK